MAGRMIRRGTLAIPTSAETDVLDLTPQVERFVAESGIEEGVLVIFVPGSTAAVTTIEFEDGAVADLQRAIERLVPRGDTYQHDRRWGDGNGYSHVRAALLGPSLSIPISGGRLATGTWQQIVLCDFDNRPRRREVMLTLLAGGD